MKITITFNRVINDATLSYFAEISYCKKQIFKVEKYPFFLPWAHHRLTVQFLQESMEHCVSGLISSLATTTVGSVASILQTHFPGIADILQSQYHTSEVPEKP